MQGLTPLLPPAFEGGAAVSELSGRRRVSTVGATRASLSRAIRILAPRRIVHASWFATASEGHALVHLLILRRAGVARTRTGYDSGFRHE